MIEARNFVISFESTHYAMQAERVLKEKNYEFDTIPTPREITLSCGLAIRFRENVLNFIRKEIQENNIRAKNIYEIKRLNNKNMVEEIC